MSYHILATWIIYPADTNKNKTKSENVFILVTSDGFETVSILSNENGFPFVILENIFAAFRDTLIKRK